MNSKPRRAVTDPEKMESYDERFDRLEDECGECGGVAERFEEWVVDMESDEPEEFLAAGFKCTECRYVEGV